MARAGAGAPGFHVLGTTCSKWCRSKAIIRVCKIKISSIGLFGCLCGLTRQRKRGPGSGGALRVSFVFRPRENNERETRRRMLKSVLKRALGLGIAVVEGARIEGGIHNRLREAPEGGAPLPGLRQEVRRLRHAPRPAVEGPGRGLRPVLRRVRAAARRVPGTRGARRGRPVGPHRVEQVRLGLRGHRGVARPTHVQERAGRAHEGRLAHRGRVLAPV